MAGLTPEDVSVIDAEGGLIGSAEEAPENAPDTRTEALRERAQRLLEARVGPGNAVVEVALDTETRTEAIRERRFDPDSRVAISTDTEETTSTSSDEGGGVTVASNVPDGDAGGENTSQSQSSDTRERVNYEVSTTEREITQGPGAIKRLTVAVLVNGTVPDATGTPVFQPRPQEELDALAELVSAAVGVNPERGDVLTIKTMQFETPQPEGTLATPGVFDRFDLDVMSLVQAAVLALVALILGLFVLRPILARPAAQAPASLDAPDPSTDTARADASKDAAPLTGEIEDGEFDSEPLVGDLRRRRARQPERAVSGSVRPGPGGAPAQPDRSASGGKRRDIAKLARRRRGEGLMSITHMLEDFGETRRGTPVSITELSLEEERLEAFERGYQAGWDDCAKSQMEESRRITADLAQNLQDLSFTYEEAYAAVMQALHPLLEQMIAAVLPRLARDSLVPRLVETVHDIAREHGHQAIGIAAAEAGHARARASDRRPAGDGDRSDRR